MTDAVWTPLDAPVNYVLIAGKKSPGIAIVEKAAATQKWDQAQGYALSGAVSRYTGDQLSEFIVRIQLWTVQDWSDWETFKTVVEKPPRGVRPRALEFWHPYTEALGISSIVVKERSQPVPILDETVFEITLSLMQYRRPTPQYSAPPAAKTAEPLDEGDRQILELMNQTDDLAGGKSKGYQLVPGHKG